MAFWRAESRGSRSGGSSSEAGDEGQALALVLGLNFEYRLESSIVLIVTSVVMFKIGLYKIIHDIISSWMIIKG